MNKILFTVIPEKGHINPYIGVAKHLQQQGHDIGFFSPTDISDQLQQADLNITASFLFPAETSESNRGEIFSKNVQDAIWLRSWIKTLLVDNADHHLLPIQAIIEEINPNIIITDPMMYSSAIIANGLNIPWVTISNSLNPVLNNSIKSELLETVDWLAKDREKLFSRFKMNVDFKGCDMLSPLLSIAFTTEEFAGKADYNVQLVGSSIPIGKRGDEHYFPWHLLNENQDIVYISFGSQIYHQPKLFKILFNAIKDKPIQVVATVNELMHSELLGDIPDNVILSYYTPQLELLSKTSVMVTHGGANSVMEAIYYSVPMLIVPLCNDQFHQAHFIEKNDIGIQLNFDRISAEQCWQAIEKLLVSKNIKNNMKTISKSYKKDGALEAANLVDSLLKSGVRT